MRFFQAYLLCGTLWAFCNLFLTDVGRVMIATSDPRYRKPMLLGALLGLLIWPVGLVFFLSPKAAHWLLKRLTDLNQ